MRILIPNKISASSFRTGTSIPEVDASQGEVLWVDSGVYSVDDLRVYEGSIYSCVKAYTATGSSKKPDEDYEHWLFKEPTNRMRPFDEYLYTKASQENGLKYVISSPFATGFAIHGIEADSYDFKYRDAPSDEFPDGEVLVQSSGQLWEQAYGHFELLFGNLQRATKWTSSKLPLRPNATAEITLVRNSPGVDAKVGWIGLGKWHEINAPRRSFSAAERGIDLAPRTTARRKDRGDGTYTRTRGLQSKVVSGNASFDSTESPRIANLLEQSLDQVVAVDFSDMPQYSHLSGIGFLTGSIISEGLNVSRMSFNFDGNV